MDPTPTKLNAEPERWREFLTTGSSAIGLLSVQIWSVKAKRCGNPALTDQCKVRPDPSKSPLWMKEICRRRVLVCSVLPGPYHVTSREYKRSLLATRLFTLLDLCNKNVFHTRRSPSKICFRGAWAVIQFPARDCIVITRKPLNTDAHLCCKSDSPANRQRTIKPTVCALSVREPCGAVSQTGPRKCGDCAPYSSHLSMRTCSGQLHMNTCGCSS